MKRILSSLLLTNTVVVTCLLPLTALAADTPTISGSGTTTVEATFVAGSEKIPLVEPTDPNTEPHDLPDKNGSTSSKGPLALVYVAKDLSFGGHNTISATDQRYKVDSKNSSLWDGNVVFEIGDERGDATQGWNLQVSGVPMKADQATIKGATITFKNGDVRNNKADSETPGTKDMPLSVTGITPQDKPINLAQEGSATNFLVADAGKGMGMTTYLFTPDNVSLLVPGSQAQAGTYTTNLNWTLTSGPKQ